jgi:hypothetical protein
MYQLTVKIESIKNNEESLRPIIHNLIRLSIIIHDARIIISTKKEDKKS